MKLISLIIAFAFTFLFQVSSQSLRFPLDKEVAGHPRILLLEGEESKVQKMLDSDPVWLALHQDILKESDQIIGLPLLERKQIGMRLLYVSREALRRIFFLSYSYRMTGEQRYAIRAEQEMLMVASFRDWNPSHFLDVAEMTLGVAIGYDWLYNQLQPTSRTIIRDAIVQKGLEPSLKPSFDWILESKHNWNQVCNAGVAFGALAVYESNPEVNRAIVDRSMESVQLAMRDYAPNGAYPEGYAYWEYGTSFNVLLISAIEKLYDNDFGLPAIEGFMNTSGYYQHMIGTGTLSFNYSDCGDEFGLTPAMFWFANKSDNPSLLWNEKKYLDAKYRENHLANRLLPAVMVWAKDMDSKQVSVPEKLMWTGGGTTPVALMRSSWTDPDAIYLGFKGGTASSNHSHMDAGSFVMEANGVRWAMDFGKQDYQSLESKKLQIWTNDQESERWKVFRYSNFVHNTLTVNNQLHKVAGYAPIHTYSDKSEFMFATSDLTSIFHGNVLSAYRAVALVNKKFVTVRDVVVAPLDKATDLRWTMLTDATVTSISDRKIVLTKDGHTLQIIVNNEWPVQIKTWSTQSPNDYDADNTGTILIGFETSIPAGKKGIYEVNLVPGKKKLCYKDKRLLKNWSMMSSD